MGAGIRRRTASQGGPGAKNHTDVSLPLVKLTTEQLDTLRKAFRLSPRETQIIALLFSGITDSAALAREMKLTVGSTKGILSRVYAKGRVSDKTQLVLACLDTLGAPYA